MKELRNELRAQPVSKKSGVKGDQKQDSERKWTKFLISSYSNEIKELENEVINKMSNRNLINDPELEKLKKELDSKRQKLQHLLESSMVDNNDFSLK